MKIAVFGGTGFIGRHLVKRLAKRGAQILVPTRHIDRALPLKVNGDVGQVVPLCGRLDDESFLRSVCGQADAVINLIGILQESGRTTFDAMHRAFPERLARIAKEAGVKALVHVSALGADKHSPSSYARSKAAGEEAVRTAFADATILRPSIVIGPEDDFFNRFGNMLRFSPVLPLIGGGKTRFQPIYVGDVAEAIAATLDDPQTAGQTYELGGPAVLTFKECMQLLLRTVDLKRCLVPVPFWLIGIKAMYLQFFPAPFRLTPDQVKLLKADNVTSPSAQTIQNLGLTPTAIELVLPTYLDKYRATGRFN